MKMVVSLSDELFEKAEKNARYMGMPINRLFVPALEDYISKHNKEMITKKLNEVYEKINQDEFTKDLNVGLESLRNLTNDTW